MADNPSFYFTLFKKFQVLNHVPGGTLHGTAGGAGGFSLLNPSAANGVFGASNSGNPLTIPDTTPSHSPLWAILNSKAAGHADYSAVTISGGAQNGTVWPTMPPGTPPAWNNFQVNAPVKLVDVFGNWIAAGQNNDVPTAVIGNIPPTPIAGPLDPGVSLFACSMPGDVGIRPDAVPANFWDTSLIYLLDPSNGTIQTPSTLAAGAEWYLAAIIGNRGNTDAGNYLNPPGVETAGVVMVWNTTFSPGVELPSLSNLDVTDTNPIFEQYFLKSGTYDVVGFRLNVQTVYDGIIAALNQAVMNNQINLGGLTPDQWVHAGGAHLCAKVLIRQQGGVFPNVGDSPINNPHLAQKNLVPFDVNVQEVDPNPNIVWKTFVSGQPYFLRLPDAGQNRLILQLPELPRDAFRFYIGIPLKTFDRYFRDGGVKGFRQLSPRQLCESPLGNKAKPFPEAVVLQLEHPDNALEFPALLEQEYLGMALGIEWDVRHIKPGVLGEIRLVHRAMLPKLTPGTRCFEIEDTVAGGFTIVLRAFDPFHGPKGQRVPFEFPGRKG
jgi:hypothetical protein